MSVELNHTIVNSYDHVKSAKFYAEILGLSPPEPFLHFMVVRLSNRVSLDFCHSDEKVEPQHYAFLVSETEFDRIFSRIQEQGITFWPDPARSQKNTINHYFGGRGFYFEDPSGHFLEVITRPYGKPDQI